MAAAAIKKEETVTMLLAELVEDDDIYPRHKVDSTYVTQLVEAIQAGVTLPPPVADRETKKKLDGWHRTRALIRVYGPEAKVPVILRACANKEEMFEYAISANKGHGRKLDQQDRVRCVAMADALGIPTKRIGIALSCNEEVVQMLRIRIASAPLSSPGVLPTPARTLPTGGKSTQEPIIGYLPLKRPLLHLAGTTLTAQQAQAAQSAPGTPYSLLAFQLRDAMQNGLINKEDERLMQALRELRDALNDYFS